MKLTKEDYVNYKKNNLNIIFNYSNDNVERLGHKWQKKLIFHSKYKNLVHKLLAFKFKMDLLLSGKASIPMLDLMITTKCTLQCEQCCSLMPQYTNESHHIETLETFKKNLDNILLSVNNIYRFQLIGGEPLLNKNLPEMLEYAATKKQLKSVQIVTNGTLLPNEDLLKMLKKYKHKCMVAVSDYRSNPKIRTLKTMEVLHAFTDEGITAYIVDYDWFSRGEIKKENRSIEAMMQEMSACWQHTCTSYCDGELHLCSRSVAIKRCLDSSIKDFVKVTDKDCSKEIVNLFSRSYVDACDYCHTDCNTKIERGIQVEVAESPQTLVAVERE